MNWAVFSFASCMFVILFSHFILAAGVVGVSPSNIKFSTVLRGGYAERFITVTTDSVEPLRISGQVRGDIFDWINFTNNLTVVKGQPARILVQVRPESDVPNGNYTGFLRLSTQSLQEDTSGEGNAVSKALAVLDVAIEVEITDFEISSCSASSYSISTVEYGDNVEFRVSVQNNGNIRLRPDVTLEIYDSEQVSLVQRIDFKGHEILPTRQETVETNFSSSSFDLGQFWVTASVPECLGSELLTFDVLESGSLKASGILTKIYSIANAEVGDTIPIYVAFENTGEKPVNARFKGTISKEGKIVQLLESDAEQVSVGETANFTLFFIPRSSGMHIASGRILYENKRTFESSTTISVRPSYSFIRRLGLIVLYGALLLIILYLIVRIRRERSKYRLMSRGMR